MFSILKRNLAAAAAALMFAGLAASASAQDAVRIGTSSAGSTFYSLAAGAGELIHKYGGLNVTVQPLGGSAPNIFGLAAGKVELALVNSYAASSGYYGTDVFKGKPVDLRVLVKAHASYRAFFVRKGARIKEPRDLVGKTLIGARPALPELKIITDNLLKVAGLSPSQVKVVSTTNMVQALDGVAAGSVDAVILAFDGKSATIERLMSEGDVDFLYLSEEERDKILAGLPKGFYGETFEAGRFTGQSKPVHLIGMDTVFAAHARVSEDVAYKSAKALMDHTKEFATFYPAARDWTAEHTLKRPALPFHPGAIRYFKEKGLWTPELESGQNALLKR